MFVVIFGIVLFVLLIISYLKHAMCKSKVRLDGKTSIITGSNTGLGKETARDFASRGAEVIIACRDLTKGESAAEDIRKSTGNNKVHVRKLDLSSLKSVREFAEGFLKEFTKLHILVNNAGLMMCPYMLTEDGFEMQFGVNHLGHFALTNLLLPRLKESGTPEAKARIINVSSSGHILCRKLELDDLLWKRRVYSPIQSYSQSKLANILMAFELHQKLGDSNISVFSLHPGAVATDLLRYYPKLEWLSRLVLPLTRWIVKTPVEGAQTSIQCAVAKDMDQFSGEYFVECKVKSSRSELSRDAGMARKLWEKSEELTGVSYPF